MRPRVLTPEQVAVRERLKPWPKQLPVAIADHACSERLPRHQQRRTGDIFMPGSDPRLPAQGRYGLRSRVTVVLSSG